MKLQVTHVIDEDMLNLFMKFMNIKTKKQGKKELREYLASAASNAFHADFQ